MDDMGGFPRGGIPVLQSSDTGTVTIDGGAVTVTDAASLLLDLQVGGASKVKVRKDGMLMWGAGTIDFGIRQSGLFTFSVNDGGFTFAVASSGPIATRYLFNSYAGGSADLYLDRDAADIMAQRRTTNTQATRIYNTYTNATNYERFAIDWKTTANTCLLRTEAEGTGTLRGMSIQQATGTLSFFGATPVVQPAGAGQAVVTLGNADSEIGGLTISAAYDQTEVTALRDKCEELADDVRALSTLVHALRTALVDLGAIKGAA